MRQAMIFAAGLGTRLKPLTDTMPKALVEVGGKPLLEHVVLRLRDAGMDRIIINVHHFSEQIVSFLSKNDNFGMDIRVSDETKCLLDTGGGIKKAVSLFDASAPVLIHNVDILSNIDLAELYEKGRGNDATLLVSKRKTKRYLLFSHDKSCMLKGWTNIETGEVRSPYDSIDVSEFDKYAFSGIHVFSPALFPLLSAMPDKFGIIDFYLRYCAERTICGYVDDSLRLMDVGKLDTLSDAEDFIKTI
ncbi:MAG: nucleotidyltransferase family protein [Prevotella sp.]